MLGDFSNISLGFTCHVLTLVWQKVSGTHSPGSAYHRRYLCLTKLQPILTFLLLLLNIYFKYLCNLFIHLEGEEKNNSFASLSKSHSREQFFFANAKLSPPRHNFSENRIILNLIFLLKNLESLVCGWRSYRCFQIFGNCSLVSLKYLAIFMLHFEVCKINGIINHSLNILFVAGWLEITDGFLQAGFNFALRQWGVRNRYTRSQPHKALGPFAFVLGTL